MERVLIVDVNHIAHNFAQIPVKLTTTKTFAGQPVTVNTTIVSGVVKNIFKWSAQGTYATAVCFDRPVPARKQFFNLLNQKLGSSGDYKGNRTGSQSRIVQDLNIVQQIFTASGVNALSAEGYEADDLVMAAVTAARRDYPGVPIDIVTNDTDLLPLVDEQVSVFIRNQKGEWPGTPSYLRKNKYYMVTPENFSEFVNSRGDFRNLYVPYNSILLAKLLRGDPADNLPGLKKSFPPKKYNAIVSAMESDGIDLGTTFRYGDLSTLDILQEYIDPELVKVVRAFYYGMDLNGDLSLSDENGRLTRKPALLGKPLTGFDKDRLQSQLDIYSIRLTRK